jgi:hypothetical protein
MVGGLARSPALLHRLPALRETLRSWRTRPFGSGRGRAPRGDEVAEPGLTHRHVVIFVSAVFLLSNALMAPGFSPVAALLVILGCAGSLAVVVRATAGYRTGFLASPVEPAIFALCGLAALVLCVLGGEGHFFFANYDWLFRDAVLADLVRQRLPAFYEYQGSEFVLRAPLGMYMIPATLGKVFGLRVAHLALLAQNVTILTLILTLFVSMVPRRKAVFLAIFVAFSGIEIVGVFIAAGLKFAASGTFSWPLHTHQHLAWWNPAFQYTNHVAQVFWVPHHAFPGWWLAALAILHIRREIDSTVLIVTFASLFFWSPLTMAGALPIVGFLVLRRESGDLLAPRLLGACVAALCFLPIVVYLGADAESVPHRWLVVLDGFWSLYVLFILIQIPQAAIVASFWRKLDPGSRTLSILSIVLLVLIPIYKLGANNDFAMRASIMPLALLAFVFGSIVVELRLRDGIGRVSAAAAVIVLGCFTPAFEVERALTLHSFAISDCNLLTTWSDLEPDRWLANYFARSDTMPVGLLSHDRAETRLAIESRPCWPDHPLSDRPITTWGFPERW